MSDTRLEWKIFAVYKQDLENKLNDLSAQDYEIFSVQFTGTHWTVIVRKSINNKGAKTMGFGAGS
jgi:hypothetical protein